MNNEYKRLDAIVEIGALFRAYTEQNNTDFAVNSKLQDLDRAVVLAGHKNSWFTRENIVFCLEQWAQLLTRESLIHWLDAYPKRKGEPKKILLILAGNIPLVGFHDFLVCYLSGHHCLIKTSSSDQVLLKFIISLVLEMVPEDEGAIVLTDEIVKNYDAVIATGSDNTARYFTHYFSKKPNIIRRNRNSIAVLDGSETLEELEQLGEDIFRYFGLGCRSVSKIYVPENYNFDSLFKALFKYKDLIELEKYSNNYDYNKAVYLMSEFKLLDNGFLLLKEDASLSSPIGSLFYEKYSSKEKMLELIDEKKDALQCVVSNITSNRTVSFGTTQKPTLTDYADGVDTMEFVLSLF